ncbi:hypothetical protein BDZ91DRAFT_727306 [Kalaharituber pfeilii]|nr:hypothetical protein BDZ91DRAFT_727306 [Kalaharituber pfeilii]
MTAQHFQEPGTVSIVMSESGGTANHCSPAVGPLLRGHWAFRVKGILGVVLCSIVLSVSVNVQVRPEQLMFVYIKYGRR